MPDLVLVDGGRGQLQAALTALDRIGIELPVVGLAKREEEIWVPDRPEPDPPLAQGPGAAARSSACATRRTASRSRATASGAASGCARRA